MNPLYRFLAAVGVLCMPTLAFSCDICGCSGGANSLGLLPLVQRHFVGFRFQSQHFHTDAHGSEPDAMEYFRTADLWGRWQPHRRLQLITAMPYQFTTRRFDDGKQLAINGLGDLSLTAQWAVIDPAKQYFRRWRHSLQIGAGLKLPTGLTNITASENEPILPALQPGTGGTDGLISGFYAIRQGVWGASTDATVRLMGKNANNSYHFGHRLNGSLRFFSTQTIGKTTFLPFAGASYDARLEDRELGKSVDDTGGWAAFGMVGADILLGDLAISLGWQAPMNSNMSNGHVSPKPRFNASVVWLFGGKNSVMKLMLPAKEDTKK